MEYSHAGCGVFYFSPLMGRPGRPSFEEHAQNGARRDKFLVLIGGARCTLCAFMIQIQQHANPPVSDGPLEHLSACHRRIEHRLDVLQRAADLLPERSAEALQAIANSLRFMDISGVLHTVDEEESLFPRLRDALSPSEIEYLTELESQHREAESLYDSLKEVVARLQIDCSEADIREYRDLVSRLNVVYRAHIASEDENLIRLAERVLTPDQLSVIQSEMRSRRR